MEDEVGTALLEHGNHLFFRGIHFPKQQVLTDCTAEERVALRHIDEVGTHERCQLHAFLSVVDFHRPFLRLQQGEKHTHKCGFSCARLAENGCAGTGIEVEAEVFQYLPVAVVIAVIHVPQTDSARSVQLYRLSLFLQRIFFQLHQPFGSSKHGHESGHQLRKLAGRTLYLVHQLQEGRHAAERQRVERHTDGSPREGDKIAESESEVQDEVGEDRELRPAHHPAAEFALCTLQSAHDHLVALERLDEHSVLDGLLENALDLRIRVAHFSCQPPHLAHINLADQDKQRYHDDDENRQTPVH